MSKKLGVASSTSNGSSSRLLVNGENINAVGGTLDFCGLGHSEVAAAAAGDSNYRRELRAADNMVAAMNEHLSSSSAANRDTSDFRNVAEDNKAGILSFPCDFDHMYASMTDSGTPATATSALGVGPLLGNEALKEVMHLKVLTLEHLNYIQQQSEQIVNQEKLLAALRQENETLKLRLERMDRRVSLQKLRSEPMENSLGIDHIEAHSPPSVSLGLASTSDHHSANQSDGSSSSPQYNETFKIRLNTSGGITTVKMDDPKNESKQESSGEGRHDWEGKKKRRSELSQAGDKRKRGVSSSSTISNNTTSTIQDSKSSNHDGTKRPDKKSKSLGKKESYLTTEEHYYTAVGDTGYTLNLKEHSPPESSSSLEVPSWRIKVYTSCYSMEGTENLDDEIFNKRHLKLENDERRRKRWDVQRIREQRHIEKLRQRLERQNHQATCYNTNHSGPCLSTAEEESISSFWPDVDQIQSLQVDSQLPVTAFGAPVPTFSPSEFSLPWVQAAKSKTRRPKMSTSRRKSSRR